MQITITIKDCKRCQASYFDGAKDVTLTPGQQVQVIFQVVRECPHCPEDIEPRTLGYRRIK